MKKIILNLFSLVLIVSTTISCNKKTEIEVKFDKVMIQTDDGQSLAFIEYLEKVDKTKPIVLKTWTRIDADAKRTIVKLLDAQKKQNNFEFIAFSIDNTGEDGAFKTQEDYLKHINKELWNCPTIYDSTGSYQEHVIDGSTGNQTYIFLNNKIVYANDQNDEYIEGKDEYLLILDAIASQKSPVHKELKYLDGSKRLSYGFDNFKQIGKWNRYFENGQLKYTMDYSIKDSISEIKKYNSNGQLTNLSYEFDGERTGPIKTYFNDGKKFLTGQYENGLRDGEWKWFHENSEIKQMSHYSNGEKDGEEITYHENGVKKSQGSFDKGKVTGEWKRFFENANLSNIGRYDNGKADGEWKWFFENGEIKQMSHYSNGEKEGEQITYHENGVKKDQGSFQKGKRTGEWKYYRENSEINWIGTYKNDKYDGEMKDYHSNGKLNKVSLYKEGKLIEIISLFDSNGEALDKGTLVNGNGVVKYYDKDDKFSYETKYIDGEKEKEESAEAISYKYYANKKVLKSLKFVDDNSTLRLQSFPIDKATKSADGNYEQIITFQVPEKGAINLFMYPFHSSWRVVTENSMNAAMTFSRIKIKKGHTLNFDDGNSIKQSSETTFISQGGVDIALNHMRGKTAYLVFIIKKEDYIKHKSSKNYVGFYLFNNQQDIDDFNEKWLNFKG